MLVTELASNSLFSVTLSFRFSLMSMFSQVGVTCIGNTPEEADEIYDRIVATLNKETGVPGA